MNDATPLDSALLGIAAAPSRFGRYPGLELVAPQASPAELDRLASDADKAANDFAASIERGGAAGERLSALRADLKRRGLDGFIVPLTDEYNGEYLPRRAQRLTWLTGFTGSAGFAIVLADRAAVWSDGRYTLQLQQQVDTALFSLHHSGEESPSDWLAANAKAGEKIGYDPWLHTAEGVARFRDACSRAGAALVPVDGNPIDAVWRDQPPPPLAPVVPHDLRYAGEDAASKRGRIARIVRDGGADATVLTMPESIAWLLNIRGGDVPHTPLPLGMAILRADETVELFIDSRKLAPGLAAHLGNAVSVAPPEAFGAALDRLGAEKASVRLDAGSAPAWVVERLSGAGASLRRGDDPCTLPKACKNAVELDGTRRAHRRDGAAVSRFLAWLAREAPSGKIDEIAAAERLLQFRLDNELIQDLSFNTISGAGPNGAIVHYRVTPATNRKIEPGQLYLVDSGGQYLDGTTDITRTIAIGSVSAEMRDRFTRVLKGHIALGTVLFPAGTSGHQLDVLARRPLWEAGLDYDHGTGHGVGSYLGVHEGPQRISKLGSGVPLRPGMIISNEPGYYKTGAYGIRIENLVVVAERPNVAGAERPMLGFDTLTRAPIDRNAIEPALLTDAERAWLNDYHRQVREELTPLVDAETAAWLAQATAPID